MKKVENKDPEVIEIKNKYKKIRNSILLVVLILLIIFFIALSVKTIKVQELLRANLTESYGNNYKMTRTDYGGAIIYFKDGNKLQRNGESAGTLSYDGKGYVLNFETKEYWDIPLEVGIFARENMVVSNCMALSGEEVNSFFKMISHVIYSGIKLGEENFNGVECYTISANNNSMKIWFDKETKYIIREGFSGNLSDVKIEPGIVKNEDIIIPWEQGFVKGKIN